MQGRETRSTCKRCPLALVRNTIPSPCAVHSAYKGWTVQGLLPSAWSLPVPSGEEADDGSQDEAGPAAASAEARGIAGRMGGGYMGGARRGASQTASANGSPRGQELGRGARGDPDRKDGPHWCAARLLHRVMSHRRQCRRSALRA